MKMTYLDLLKAVSEGTQPRVIKYGTKLFRWNECEYVSESERLSDFLDNWTTKAQTTAEFIEIIAEYLNEKEKKYLSAVIKPFRERTECIRKNSDGNYNEFISIDLNNERFFLPYFGEGEMYKGMEIDKEYTLEELGL